MPKKPKDEKAPGPEIKDPNAVALGRKGGLRGGPARANKLTPEQRSESARKAVQARWAKYRAAKKLNSGSVQGKSPRKKKS